MKSVVLPFLAVLPLLVAAQTPSGDYGFHTNQLWWPAALSAVGAIGTAGTFHQDYPDDHWRTPHTGTGVDDVLRFVPSATYVGLAFTRLPSRHSLTERLLAAATAHTAAVAITQTLKHCVNERRPDGTDYCSFPSGHAAIAFTGAELLRIEYGWPLGLAGYGVATAVAICRVSRHRHWFNDVAMGAGIGIACARAAYWLLPLERRLFHLKTKHTTTTDAAAVACPTSIAIAPSFDPFSRTTQLTIAAVF